MSSDGKSRDFLLGLYRTMWKIRAFEEKATELFQQGRLPGFLHSSVGQEAVAAGACAALRLDDYITSTHRGHGHVIAKGAELGPMFAELYGKVTGYCRGKGGSMHIMDFSKGILGANGIVGGGIPIATGAGLSARLRGTDQVVVSFFGDGASNTGGFHEAINMAAIWELPVIFLCEHNLYAESTHAKTTMKIENVSERAPGYGIPGVTVDGNDVLAVYDAVKAAVERARRGEGPTLLEAKTYRWYGHYIGDPAVYRPAEEVEAWKQRDPIQSFEQVLLHGSAASEADLENIRQDIAREVDEAVAFAETSPEPDPSEALMHIFAD